MTLASASSRVDNIRRSLVGLKMPRALEMLDATLRRIEQGQIDGIEALDELLLEELSLRENRRIKAALRMARLPVMKTLAGFDFAFQPSLDRNRIMALAGLDFIVRAEVVHLLGPPGTGKSHLATALAVEAVRAGKLVYFIPLADLVAQLAKAEREGRLVHLTEDHLLIGAMDRPPAANPPFQGPPHPGVEIGVSAHHLLEHADRPQPRRCLQQWHDLAVENLGQGVRPPAAPWALARRRRHGILQDPVSRRRAEPGLGGCRGYRVRLPQLHE